MNFPTIANTPQAAEFDRARDAGMNPNQAARWVAYLAKCDTEGRDPITLHEAVAQIAAAKARP